MNHNFKKRLWIGLSVTFGSIVAAAIGFYFLSNDLQTQATNVMVTRAAIQNRSNVVANFAALEADAPKAEQYAAAIQQLLPDQSGLIVFNSWVSQIAKNYNVAATVAFQGNPVPSSASSPGTIDFTMTAQGPEGSIGPFLTYLSSQASGFILSFSSFDFTNNKTAENLTAQGTVYFR